MDAVAFYWKDGEKGINVVASTVSNMMNTPVEVLEMALPLWVEGYAIIPDRGGAGTFRGGLSARRVWCILGVQARTATCCDRTITPPFGLAGGAAGSLARLVTELPDGTSRPVNGKGGFIAPHRARAVVEAPGSGGYRPPPARRNPEGLEEARANCCFRNR